MNRSKRKMVVGVVAVSMGAPAFAQFGGLGGMGGGSKSSGDSTDPGKLQTELKNVIELTSTVMSKLADALGMKETSAKLIKNANDIKGGSIGLPDSASAVGELTAAVTAEMEKNQKEGKKLDSDSTAKALEAAKPGIDTVTTWIRLIKDSTKLDKGPMAIAKFKDLFEALPKAKTAAENTGSAMKAGISYLKFSGVDTTSLEGSLGKALQA